MSLLPFGELAAYRPRRFVPGSVDFGTWTEIAPLFDRLEAQLKHCASLSELERWLLDWGELEAALDEEGARRYIAMTCHTDNEEAKQSYLAFVETIEPQLKPRQFQLSEQFLAHSGRAQLPADRYAVHHRDTALKVELFRSENVPLETEETKLGQQYQELSGSLTVTFRGVERTLPQMAPYLEEPDRALRQQAWELVARRRLQERDKFEALFDALVDLRDRIATNAGFANYRDYSFRARRRFDYSSAECVEFHGTIEQEIMPLVKELQADRQRQLKLRELRPWDLEVDPASRPPLRPFRDAGQLVERCQQLFDRIDPDLAGGFRKMQTLGLLDLANRKGKAPGGYQATLNEARLPFIFMNAVGLQLDVETLLHEAGHAFHALATREEDLYHYRNAPIEFCEVASMSMELLGNEHLEQFQSDAEARRARRTHLELIIKRFPWIATVDAFQHWIYQHRGHSRSERRQAWLELMNRFGGLVDWTGHEETRANLWHRQLHIFLHPFYYVEYGIAQLGALQVWANSKQDPAGALRAYQQGLALGGSRPLPELFRAAGCRFDFSAKTIRPLVELLRRELDQSPSVSR
ncbi:MAG TPA: M3 family oligoendopeptidase [Verrucomicrobiae bacterium]|nr:M3 family oligoendopeptidase [Verrucomicrobiae bacterium]